MKSFLLLIICSIYTNLYGQAQETHLLDFCRCDYSGGYEHGQRAHVVHYTEIEKRDIELLTNSGEIVLFREYYFQENNTKYEYIRLSKDTFNYVEYDEEHRTLNEGNIYFRKDTLCCADTLEALGFTDEGDLVAQKTMVRYHPKIRHGKWKIQEAGYFSSGRYEHGKKEGEWTVVDYDNSSWKKQTYVDGTLRNEVELNLIHGQPTQEQVLGLLMGKAWKMKDQQDTLSFRPGGGGARATFEKDYIIVSGHHGGYRIPWRLSFKNKTMAIHDKNYKIIWLREDFVELQKK